MTTPTPLDQQRQLVRSFVTADRQRRERETTAQQQFAAGEKAATEQRAASERTAQQQYAAAEKSAEQQYSAAIKQADDEKSRQQRQLQDAANTIGNGWSVAVTDLGALRVPAHDLPPQLDKASPRTPSASAGAQPLAQFQANATQVARLYQQAGQLLLAHGRQQALRRKLLITAAVVAVLLAVAGYFGFQQWSYDQKLASLYQAGQTALDEQDWQAAQERLNELLAIEPGYQDAQLLLYDSYYLAGQTAFDAGDWQAGLAQLGELLRLQPNHAEARALINEHALEIGEVTNPRDGALYVPVPAGEFLMGSPEGVGQADEHPQHTVYLDAFWIMQTEVTNAQYAQCVAAGACGSPDNSRWQDAAYADHPVTYVDWDQANAYAQWAGGRLPTEAEWEKAARGTDGRTYPWGNEAPAASLANCCHFVNDTTPVGSYPAGASPYGALDMAGNVWEWTSDWYDSSYYSQSPAQNPSGPTGGNVRVMRGGAYDWDAAVVRVAVRNWSYPDVRFRFFGFRVVSSSPGF
jgi:formylglycine-generating enzyme required for sulfatase activity